MSSQSDRDKRLNSFRETFKTDLDDTNRRLHNDIKQAYLRDFEDELRQAELTAKKGDMLNALIHLQRAEIYDNLIKSYN